MKPGLTIALTVSVLMIGTAMWLRFSGEAASTEGGLVAVERYDTSDWYYEDILNDFLEPKETGAAKDYEPLTGTDAISRQLLIDYVGLAGSGQASPSELEALANRYIDSIPTLQVSRTFNAAELKVVANSKANFQAYSNSLNQIFQEYSRQIGRVQGNDYSSQSNTRDLASLSVMSKAYNTAAESLKELAVPAELGKLHVDLINSYYSSATAMEAISNTESDAASAFAGLLVINKNSGKELDIAEEITTILASQGI